MSTETKTKDGLSMANLFLTSAPAEDIVMDYEQIEAELKEFELEERKRLGLQEEEPEHWHDSNPQEFKRDQRDSTTILVGGLTLAHDRIVTAGFAGLGYKVKALDCPDYEALRFGKEFGNRGQCNPTYFTVGNLLKHLTRLRDQENIPVEQIIKENLFITAGACGPCRFGTYVTEYRKALTDAGFEGFRVLLFQQQGGLRQATGDNPGLEFTPKFFLMILKGLMAADVLNAIGYRIRPYEVVPGETNKAIEECRQMLEDALRHSNSIMRTLYRCRRRLSKVRINRLQPKPKVSIIGEFWAMTTEGDGNYRLQSFLESEGAEVDVQLVTAWILYSIWEHQYDTRRREDLRVEDADGFGLKGTNPRKKLAALWVAEKTLRGVFQMYAKTIGLNDYVLPSMDELATISHQYYDNQLRGGEGHMEVGKLIQCVKKKKAHMMISVKPFGCMPSSGVSDGIQSLITSRYPEAIFTAIETTGDGEVNVQSRIQMDLFKARQRAEKEFQEIVDQTGMTLEELRRRAKNKTLSYPKHVLAGTGANELLELTA